MPARPQPYRAPNGPNGHPPTPPPSWRPDARPPGPPTDGPPPDHQPPERRPTPPSGGGSSPSLRWVPWIVLALIAAAFIVSSLAGSGSSKADLTYSEFTTAVDNGNVKSIDFNKSSGAISGKFVEPVERQVGVLELGAEGQPPRHDARPDQEEEHRLQLRRRRQQHPRRHPALGPAARADHRALRVDEPPRAGSDGRGHEHRQEPGEGLQHREAEDDVRRRRRDTAR